MIDIVDGLQDILQDVQGMLTTRTRLGGPTSLGLLQLINDSLEMLHEIEESSSELTEDIAALRRRFLAAAAILEDITPEFKYEYDAMMHITRHPVLTLASRKITPYLPR